jgi:hypothetical protein
MYAQIAHNVHCAHGAIERRPGIELVTNNQLPAPPEVIYHHSSATGDESTEWYAAAVFVGGFWKIYRLRADQAIWDLIYTQDEDMTDQRHLRPNFYRVSKDYVLVTMPAAHCFGLGRDGAVIPAGGTITYAADDLFDLYRTRDSLPSDSDSHMRGPVPEGGGVYADPIAAYYWLSYGRQGSEPGEYIWPFAWETNAQGPFKCALSPMFSGLRFWSYITMKLAASANPPAGATHYRLFRQFYIPTNDGSGDGLLEGFSQTARCCRILPDPTAPVAGETPDTMGLNYAEDAKYLNEIATLDQYLWDGTGQDELLDEVVAPTRNAQPPKGCMLAAIHQNKMFYARIPDTLITASRPRGEDRLYYSAESEYFHVADENVMVVGEDGRPITGLMTYFGNLLIFKEDEVWALRGSLDLPTNVTDAMGDAPPWGTHELSLVARGVGCIAVKGGPAVLEAGNLLYFVGQGGLYVYNGQVIAEVSQAIAPALRGITVDMMAGSQLAHDPINKLLYWLIGDTGTPGAGQGPLPLLSQIPAYWPQLWVYHYADATDQGGGRWTHWAIVGDTITAIASRQTSILAQPPGPQLVVGLHLGRVAQTADVHMDDVVPAFPTGILWVWHGADLHLGAPERPAHWHYLTVQFEKQEQDAAKAGIFLNGEVGGDGLSATYDLGNFDLNNAKRSRKWRLGLRAKTLTPRFEGVSEQAPARITGFQIDALPIGSR